MTTDLLLRQLLVLDLAKRAKSAPVASLRWEKGDGVLALLVTTNPSETDFAVRAEVGTDTEIAVQAMLLETMTRDLIVKAATRITDRSSPRSGDAARPS